MSDPNKKIECSQHPAQENIAAYVCQHLVNHVDQGFFVGYDPDYPDDPFPDAWCARCEKKLDEAGGDWTEEAQAFASIRLICSNCYSNVRLRNLPANQRRRFRFAGLEDAEQMHREYPASYSIPRLEERLSLQTGQLVKLVFLMDASEPGAPAAERMWVTVGDTTGERYLGTLVNDPAFIADLSAGSEVAFGPENVCAVFVEQGCAAWIDLSQPVWCSSQVLSGGWPTFAYRVDPTPDMSGWVVMRRPPQTDKKEELAEVPMHELLDQFRCLDSIFGEPACTAWIWDEWDLEYKKVVVDDY